jgi:molybdopterin converting factor small subunit
LKDLLGQQSHPVELPPDATVGTLLSNFRTNSTLWDTLAVAVNREYANLTTPLHDGDEVALLPPVSGGAQ